MDLIRFLSRLGLAKKGVLLLALGLIFCVVSCYDDYDDKIREASVTESQNFVYQGMKYFYLYKEDKAVLGDDYFTENEELYDFLGQYDSPERLFNDLLFDQDRFSIIVPDYHVLEDELNGISQTTGMMYGLVKIEGSNRIFGYVRYVLPNTPAAEKGVKRGMLFSRINDMPLKKDNIDELMEQSSYSIGLAEIKGQALQDKDETIDLTKEEYTEDPIFIDTTLESKGHKIGYLMYNGFTPQFDSELNSVFADFKADDITDLVVDLRYNGGGSIATSQALASMIAGQFEGKVFAKEKYNKNFPDEEIEFDDKTQDGDKINSLHLEKVYIIASQSTASASEMLINCLNPYIDVVQIGENTVGKFQGSTTVYDSKDFTRSAVQPGHTYAMQPLVLKTANADDFTDYVDGLEPDIEQSETITDLGQLGKPDEPLLHRAIQEITGSGLQLKKETLSVLPVRFIGDSKMDQLSYQRMYLSENPGE